MIFDEAEINGAATHLAVFDITLSRFGLIDETIEAFAAIWALAVSFM